MFSKKKKKDTIILRGHHLRIMYDYAYYSVKYKKSPGIRDFYFQLKDDKVLAASIEDGHSKKHGKNIADVMRKCIDPKVNIKMVDHLDDICAVCNEKDHWSCKKFMPDEITAANDDRAVIHYYGLARRKYTSKYVIKRLIKVGHPWGAKHPM